MSETTMRAAVLRHPREPLAIEDVPMPDAGEGMALLKVLACGVCRTDLHIADGDLPTRRSPVIPGHQIVAELVADAGQFHAGDRVGVSWIGGVDGTCPYCRKGRENLCDDPVYTGYTVDGGYAEYTVARTDFLLPMPGELDPRHAAPLLCAGIIGFRSARVAEVQPGQRVGLFGLGSSGQLLMQVLKHWRCEVYVSTRGEDHQARAHALGAAWVGDGTAVPPVKLDAAITFAPSGDVVLAALRSLAKGGIVAINAIHLDRMPEFDYDTLLWGERQIRSVTNMTRQDAKDFLAVAAEARLTPELQLFRLDQANDALNAVRADTIAGSAVILPAM